MAKISLLIYMIFGLFSVSTYTQELAIVKGKVTSENNELVPFADVFLKSTSYGVSTNINGKFCLEAPEGEYTLIISAQGFKTFSKTITLQLDSPTNIDVSLSKDILGLDEVVISATRNRVKKRDAPVIVSTVGQKIFKATQSLSLADGLQFSPGVRIENNCQNCGFTQVRLNGLDGSYTQILVDSRPIFSSLLGVYGLEQIPSNIIDRVEVVRSGGSALYGSNAIAGTVNVITKYSTPGKYQVIWELLTVIPLIEI